MSNRKKRLQILIGGAAVVAVIIYLVTDASLTQGVAYYRTVSELQAEAPNLRDQGVRLGGRVLPGSIVKKGGSSLEMTFQIYDEAFNTVPVQYAGIAPDIFGEDMEVVVEGEFRPEGVFVARTLMAKCPTKYEEKAGGDATSSRSVAAD